MLWQNKESPPAICQGYFQHRSALSGWIFKCGFLHCPSKTFARPPQEAGTYRCGYVVCKSKASYTQEKASCALLTVHFRQWDQFPSRLKNIALSLKTGQGSERGQERGESAVRLSWGGCLWWCSCTVLQNRAWDVHHWASSCRSHPFGEESTGNTARNSAIAALLNTAWFMVKWVARWAQGFWVYKLSYNSCLIQGAVVRMGIVHFNLSINLFLHWLLILTS